MKKKKLKKGGKRHGLLDGKAVFARVRACAKCLVRAGKPPSTVACERCINVPTQSTGKWEAQPRSLPPVNERAPSRLMDSKHAFEISRFLEFFRSRPLPLARLFRSIGFAIDRARRVRATRRPLRDSNINYEIMHNSRFDRLLFAIVTRPFTHLNMYIYI